MCGNRKETIQFGMPTLIELSSLGETFKLCRKLGLDFVELNMNLPDYQADKLEEIEALLELKERYGIYYTIHLDENLNICDFNRAVAQAYTDTVRRTITAAKKLGSPILNMHMNHGVYFTLPERKVELFAVYGKEYREAWTQFRCMCEDEIGDFDIRICIENTDGFRDYEKEAMQGLLESPVFGLTWDIGHSHSVGNIDEAFLMEHGDELQHFHIHDALGEKNHRALGTGEIDLIQRLQLAKAHHCRCVLETKTVEGLEESVGWLWRNWKESCEKYF